ncbi:hypothetical protein [Microbacterium lacticum]|uniref:Uncharacterized protein n=1 Tax=Microbacterium lacticum TaxID=33885 RepID=A0A4Y3UGV5_9MICO|nr:hypothetical protein [Microbacterium lacticum]TQN00745.1 hypothetical protein FHX68_0863 [Microbacterium lacticum]GEB94171.1 hypothetical protein MLA01_03900 [Microbacterium lacticum]GGN13846.1 hypothetical protein GCM10009724_04050 [Microbacterium lacticum]
MTENEIARQVAKREYQRARLDYKTARDALIRVEAHHPDLVHSDHPLACLPLAEWGERCRVRREAASVAWSAYIDAKVALARCGVTR